MKSALKDQRLADAITTLAQSRKNVANSYRSLAANLDRQAVHVALRLQGKKPWCLDSGHDAVWLEIQLELAEIWRVIDMRVSEENKAYEAYQLAAVASAIAAGDIDGFYSGSGHWVSVSEAASAPSAPKKPAKVSAKKPKKPKPSGKKA
jgi:hypothetical protein